MKKKSVVLSIGILCLMYTIFGGQTSWEPPTTEITITPAGAQLPGTPLHLSSTSPIFIDNGYLAMEGGGKLLYDKISGTEAMTATPYTAEGDTVLSIGTAKVTVSVSESTPPPSGTDAYFNSVYTAMNDVSVAAVNCINAYGNDANYPIDSEEYKFLTAMSKDVDTPEGTLHGVVPTLIEEQIAFFQSYFDSHPTGKPVMAEIMYANGYLEKLQGIATAFNDATMNVDSKAAIPANCSVTNILTDLEGTAKIIIELSSYAAPVALTYGSFMAVGGASLTEISAFVKNSLYIFGSAAAAGKTISLTVPSYPNFTLTADQTKLKFHDAATIQAWLNLSGQDITYATISSWLMDLATAYNISINFYAKNAIKIEEAIRKRYADPQWPFSGPSYYGGVEYQVWQVAISDDQLGWIESYGIEECNSMKFVTGNTPGVVTVTVTIMLYWKPITASIQLEIEDSPYAILDLNERVECQYYIPADPPYTSEQSGTFLTELIAVTTDNNQQCDGTTIQDQEFSGMITMRQIVIIDNPNPEIGIAGNRTEMTIPFSATIDLEIWQGTMFYDTSRSTSVFLNMDGSETVLYDRYSDPLMITNVTYNEETEIMSDPTGQVGFWTMWRGDAALPVINCPELTYPPTLETSWTAPFVKKNCNDE